VVIGLIVTPEGFPLAYEVMAGNTSDKKTLGDFLRKIESQYGKAHRIWVMDRGIPTEAVLAQMRASDPPVSYLVGTPKGRLSRLESKLTELSWQGVRRREGHYLLRSNLSAENPEQLWKLYIQLTHVEEAFKNLKEDLSLRPIHHQKEHRIEAHIFVAFLAYCLHVTLHRRLRDLAPGLTPRSVLEKFSAMQMIDVHLPTTDRREVILTRYTQPEKDQELLLRQLKLRLPEQPPPKIRALKQPSA